MSPEQRPSRANLIELDGDTRAASIGEAYGAAMLWLFNGAPRP